MVQHGTGATSYWTAYLPYSFAAVASATFLQFYAVLNMDGYAGGNVTIDNIRTISPTWANGTGSADTSWASTTTYPGTAGTIDANTVLPTNWIGGFPGGKVGGASGAVAQFEDLEGLASGAPNTVTTTLDDTWTLGTLSFNTTAYQYTITPGTGGLGANNQLIMDNTINSAPAQINVIDGAGGTQSITSLMVLNSTTDVTITNAADSMLISGNISGAGGLGMAGAGTLKITGNNSYSGGTTVSGGKLVISGTAGALPANSAVSITGGTLQFALNSDPTRGETLSSLSISVGGALDLGNNHMIISDSGGSIDSTIRAYLAAGYNGGGWNGASALSGVITTTAPITIGAGTYSIGYADGANNVVAGLPSGELEVAYTLAGDANLDGKVDSADFGILADNYGASGAVWDAGDFNYDGKVDSADFGILAVNYGQSAGSNADVVTAADWSALDAFAAANGMTLSQVPEPASLGILAVSGVAILGRRRRRSPQPRVDCG